MIWELVLFLIVLKIPIVYLCAVVYWAIKAEPEPLEGATIAADSDGPDPRPGWRRRLRPRRPTSGPHGPSRRRRARRGRVALVHAERRP